MPEPADCLSCEFGDCSECAELTTISDHGGCCCGGVSARECLLGDWHDDGRLHPDDVDEMRLQARDYEAWADL